MENVYAPPAASVADAPRATDARQFMVVAPRKFVLLFMSTLGLYQFYWWYMQWARHRRFTGQPMWPVARAIFSVFFAHSLNEEVDHRARPLGLRWSPGAWATVYVVATIVSAISDRLAAREVGTPLTTLLGIALLPVSCIACLQTQRAANIACGDPTGSSNRSLTWANAPWLVIGALMWLLVVVGLYVQFNGIAV